MGRNRNIRLTERLEADVEQYLTDNETNFTALVIEGVTSIIYGKVKKQECTDKPAPEIVVPAASDEADFRPSTTNPLGIRPKKVKGAIKTKAIPIVAALLSGVSRPPLHAHHPACTCGVCRAANE